MKLLIIALLLSPSLVFAQDADIQPTDDPNIFHKTVVQDVDITYLQKQIDVYQGKIDELRAEIKQAQDSVVEPTNPIDNHEGVNWTELT